VSISRDNQSVQYDDRSYTQRLEDRIHELEVERIKEDELMASSYMSPAHKVLLRAIRRIIHGLHKDETTPTIIHLRELVSKTGISEVQIRRLIEELDRWGLITKSTKKWKEGKEWKSEMTIAIGGQVKYSPAEIITPRQKAGGYQRCHNCGSKNIEPVVYKCNDCGHHGPIE
jgi:transcription initiation factor IIE alpha subunit